MVDVLFLFVLGSRDSDSKQASAIQLLNWSCLMEMSH